MPNVNSLFRALVAACALGTTAGGAAAQTMLPPSLDPSRLEQRFERPPQPQSVPEIEMPEPDKAPPPKDAERVTLTLTAVEVAGNSVYGADDLRPLWQGLLGRAVTLAEVYGVRDAITAKYRNDGYVLSQAIVPAQRIRNGVVRLQVVEGYVNEVIVQGEADDRLGLLRRMGEKIKASRPLRMDVMERYVLLADDLAGVAVRTVLEPAEGVPGASNLTLTLERTPVSGFVAVDNRGTRSVGPIQMTASAAVDDQLGLFDRTIVQGIAAWQMREFRYLDLSHAVPVDAEGTVVEIGVRRSWSRPGDSVKSLELDSLNSTVKLGVTHPFVRRRAESLYGNASFTVRNTRTLAMSQALSEDRLRVLNAGLSYDVSDAWEGSNLFQLQVSKGLEILHPTRSGSDGMTRTGGRADFRKLTLTAQRNQKINDTFSVVLAGEAQYSPDLLLSSEEFGVGGNTYGRAFDSSEITGDNGFSTRAEMRCLFASDSPGLDYTMLYGFTDYGAVWNYETGSRHGRQSLASAGAGVRVGLFQRIDATLEVAKPFILVPTASDDRGPRAFFTVSTRF